MHDGFEAGKRLMLERVNPAVIRVYDEPETIKQIKKILGTNIERGCNIVIGLGGSREQVSLDLSRVVRICSDLQGSELPTGAWDWWNHRYNFYYPPQALDFPLMFGTMDTLCTFENMERLYHTKKQALESRYAKWNLEYIAHMSHWYPWGVMVYDRFTIEHPPQDPDKALALHNEIWNLPVRTAIECGGVTDPGFPQHHGPRCTGTSSLHPWRSSITPGICYRRRKEMS